MPVAGRHHAIVEGTRAGHRREHRAGSHDRGGEEARAAEQGDYPGGGKLGLVKHRERGQFEYVTWFTVLQGISTNTVMWGFRRVSTRNTIGGDGNWVLFFFGARGMGAQDCTVHSRPKQVEGDVRPEIK